MTEDARRYAPAVARNREPILEVLQRYLPLRGLVLEVASGSGEHVTHFAKTSAPESHLPAERSRPPVPVPASMLGLPPLACAISIGLDAASEVWPIACADSVLCINMIHIAPWTAAIGLMRGYVYGPFRREGRHTAPSNEAFDRDLRTRDPAWGVRDIEAVATLATAHK